MAAIGCIEDLHRLYRRRVPRPFVEYCDASSWSGGTLKRCLADFSSIELRQCVPTVAGECSVDGTLLGVPVRLPVALAPVGMLGMQRADGEMLAARAAARFGVPFTLSTMSICSIEDVARFTGQPFWFQLYIVHDHAFVEDLVDRARQAQCSALVMTLDVQFVARRHLNVSIPRLPSLGLASLANAATHPAWCWRMARTRHRTLGNIVGHAKGVHDVASLARWAGTQFDRGPNWEDVAWIRKLWQGKLVLKGILTVEDARRAVDLGADAIVVSNHGGRQLDGTPSSIRVLPKIAAAVGGDCEVWLDSGIRSGLDVFKALALGARGVLMGRAMVYGLGALGERGVETALTVIQRELDFAMVMCGAKSLAEIGPQVLAGRAGQPMDGLRV